MNAPTPLAPTAEAVDDWLAKDKALRRPDGSRHASDGSYGVDIRTRSGSWRCVTSRVVHNGRVVYWTIRGEGSSNEGRETYIYADDIAEARGWHTDGY